jgi:hypothetical protein
VRITPADVQAWCEPTKLPIAELEDVLDTQVEAQVMGTLEAGFDVSPWVDTDTTPRIIRNAIAMKYASLLYDRTYSEDSDSSNAWAARLDMMSDDLISGMLDGSVTIDGFVSAEEHSNPEAYPTDQSSTPMPERDGFRNVQWSPNHISGDPSAQPPAFSVGMRF